MTFVFPKKTDSSVFVKNTTVRDWHLKKKSSSREYRKRNQVDSGVKKQKVSLSDFLFPGFIIILPVINVLIVRVAWFIFHSCLSFLSIFPLTSKSIDFSLFLPILTSLVKYGSHFISRCDEVSDVIQLLPFDYTSLLFFAFYLNERTLDKKSSEIHSVAFIWISDPLNGTSVCFIILFVEEEMTWLSFSCLSFFSLLFSVSFVLYLLSHLLFFAGCKGWWLAFSSWLRFSWKYMVYSTPVWSRDKDLNQRESMFRREMTMIRLQPSSMSSSSFSIRSLCIDQG